MRPGRLGRLFLFASCCLAASPAELTPEQRADLQHLALARARADLWRHVSALPLSPRVTVGEWAARDLNRDRALRLWVRQRPMHRQPRFYSDRTCDVTVRLDPETLEKQLQTLKREHPGHDPALSDSTLRSASARWPTLWGQGTAGLDECSADKKPVGWEDVTFEGLELASRAAEADARYALLEEIAGLRATRARNVRAFLDSSPEVKEAVLAALEREAEVSVQFAPDQVAVAQARIGMMDIVRILTDAYQRHYRGDLFQAADFRGMALIQSRTEMSAVGLATPPPTHVRPPRYTELELDSPGWAKATLRAVGRYTPDPGEKPTPEQCLERARLNGLDGLREQVLKLPLAEKVTVEAFLAAHEELKDDVIVFLTETRVVGTPRTIMPADAAENEVPATAPADPSSTLATTEVDVELPLRRLWWILRRGIERVEVFPESTVQPGSDRP